MGSNYILPHALKIVWKWLFYALSWDLLVSNSAKLMSILVKKQLIRSEYISTYRADILHGRHAHQTWQN